MMILRPLLALALVFTLATAAADGAKPAEGKKKKKGGQAGRVTAVASDSITIKIGGKKKGQPATEAKEEKIKVNDQTVVEKTAGAKGERQTTAVKLGDIQTGERVVIQAENGVAKKIMVFAKKKKKKNT